MRSTHVNLNKDALVELIGNHGVVYGRWDRQFGFWQIGAAGATRYDPAVDDRLEAALLRLTPPPGWPRCLTLIEPGVDWEEWYASAVVVEMAATPEQRIAFLRDFPSLFYEQVKDEFVGVADDSDAGESYWHHVLREVDAAYDAYVEVIPPDCRAIAVGFPRPMRWKVLEAIWEAPDLASELVKELRSVGASYLIACILLTEPESRQDLAYLIRTALQTSRRTFMARLLGCDVGRLFFDCLKLCACQEASIRRDLQHLATLSVHPNWRHAVKPLPVLPCPALSNFQGVPDWAALPVLAAYAFEYPNDYRDLLGRLQQLVPDEKSRKGLVRELRRLKRADQVDGWLYGYIERRLKQLAIRRSGPDYQMSRALRDYLAWHYDEAPSWYQTTDQLVAGYHLLIAAAPCDAAAFKKFKRLVYTIDQRLAENALDAASDVACNLAICFSWDRFEHWYETWAQLLSADLTFPPPPLPASVRLRPLTSPAEITRAGQELWNCLGFSHAINVMSGDFYYYLWEGPEKAGIEIMRSEEGWEIQQCAGFENKPVSEATFREIHLALFGTEPTESANQAREAFA